MSPFPENAPRIIQIQLDRAGRVDEDFLHIQAERYFKIHVELISIGKTDWKARSIRWDHILALIPFVIEWWATRDNLRRVLPQENFPEIKEMTTEFAARGLIGALKNVKEMIDWYPDMSPWKEIVEKAFEMMRICDGIRKLLVNSNAMKQGELRKALVDYGGRDISNSLKALEKYDIIAKLQDETGIVYKMKNVA